MLVQFVMLDWKLDGGELVWRGLGLGGCLLSWIGSCVCVLQHEALEAGLGGRCFGSAWEVVV